MKTYKLEVTVNNEHELIIDATNDGFLALEVLGLLHWKMNDIQQQLNKKIKPDVVKRTVIVDEQEGKEDKP